jgi:hypothetical protein
VIVIPFGALAVASVLFAARTMPEGTRLERACAAAVLVPALAIGLVYLLGTFHAIGSVSFVAATLMVLGIALAAGGSAGWAILWSDVIATRDSLAELRRSPTSIAAMLVAGTAVALAMTSVYLFQPWGWDSVAYHLPIVHDALQTGTIRHVPTSVAYVNCYPRLVDVFFVAWRVSLRDDTWIELGQLPFAIAGVIAIATIAERSGVSAARGLAMGSLWLAIPVAMLELAHAYVDIAVGALALASFALATGSMRGAAPWIAGIAIGLLLGSKPSAPPIAAVAMATLFFRSARSRRPLAGLGGCVIAFAIGVWKFVENILEWGNPIWPAHARIGPILLPGKATMAALAESNLREPYLSMSWLERVVTSWTAIPDGYIFDMRIGGFGPLFTFALLPLGIATAIAAVISAPARRTVRPVALAVSAAVIATLASPGAYWARYTLAIPGALLALGIALSAAMPRRWRIASEVYAIVLAIAGIAVSWRGLTDVAPSLFELAGRSQEERMDALALDAQERAWHRARERVGPGEAFGYDWSFGLPGRLWRPDGRGRVVFLERTTPTADELYAWAERHRVRVVVLGEGPTGAADTVRQDIVRRDPARFRELFASDYPDWQPCAVFEVLLPPPTDAR